ncbi:MAG: methyltransferase domain-containing protein [Ignavibacteria bacterium]
MIIPGVCLEWLKLQRSGYKNIKDEFLADIKNEFKLMVSYLPEKVNSILDIGCGIGAIDVLLHNFYYRDNPKIYLLDSEINNNEIVYGFNRGESFYNSFNATKQLMKANNIKNYTCHDIKNGFPDITNVDLIISLLSWGYHYPVDEYLNNVRNCIADNGVLILNVRENTQGIKRLKSIFSYIDIIDEFNKSSFVYCSEVKK